MESYQRESLGKLAPFIEQAAANPELMKDPMFRAQLQSSINNIDYTKLGMLEQSAANMKARLQNIAKLEAAGKYNKNWDDVDISNWDTLSSQGVMNSLIPMEYQTLEAFGTPFVDKLKPTFYKGVDPNNPKNKLAFTNWMSITRDDIARQFAQHINDIKMDPKGRKHYEDIARSVLAQNPNATQEQIDEVFIDALTTRQSDKIISTPVVDQVGLQTYLVDYKYKKEAEKAAREAEQAAPYESPRESLTEQYNSNYNDYVERNLTDEKRKDYAADQASQKESYILAQYYKGLYDDEVKSGNGNSEKAAYYGTLTARYANDAYAKQREIFRKEFSNMYGSDKLKPEDFDKQVDANRVDFTNTSKKLIDNIGGEIPIASTKPMLEKLYPPTKVSYSGGEADGFMLPSSANMVLPSVLAAKLMGANNVNVNQDDFAAALMAGMIKNVKIIPQSKGTIVADPDIQKGSREYVKATAVIDPSDYNFGDVSNWIFPVGFIQKGLNFVHSAWQDKISKKHTGLYTTGREANVQALGGYYNSDTNKIELEVYVPIGETAEQAKKYNAEINKEAYGTTTNTEDRYGYTDRVNQQRLNLGF